MSEIVANFTALQKKIRKSERLSGRKENSVQLIAVSKMQSHDALQAALDCGHRLFGENKVQEALDHWQDLKPFYPDLRLHLIGPLQTNKAKEAVALFNCIETVDREKLVDELAKEMQKQGRDVPCFIQVNTGEEDQKAGVLPQNLKPFYAYCQKAGLNITGLMCIPPVDEPSGLHFALLNKLARELGLSELSMGMSADFEKAIPLSATYVRVGTALFGNRL
jgi:pyridoxal phosphate enzyme (YggS family)